jgi:hypothetical protein
MSQMTMLPVRQAPAVGQPRCVHCRSLIDLWAQFICDDCRRIYIGQFFGWCSRAPEVSA